MADSSKRVLAAAHGKLWVDNVEIGEFTELMLDISIDREDVQWGLGKDSKMVGVTGTGSYVIDKVYTRGKSILDSIKSGKDYRVKLTWRIKDPDSVGDQFELGSIEDVWFTTFNLAALTKGAKVGDTYEIGFNPEKADITDSIA